jgi:hypothetical protein
MRVVCGVSGHAERHRKQVRKKWWQQSQYLAIVSNEQEVGSRSNRPWCSVVLEQVGIALVQTSLE